MHIAVAGSIEEISIYGKNIVTKLSISPNLVGIPSTHLCIFVCHTRAKCRPGFIVDFNLEKFIFIELSHKMYATGGRFGGEWHFGDTILSFGQNNPRWSKMFLPRVLSFLHLRHAKNMDLLQSHFFAECFLYFAAKLTIF